MLYCANIKIIVRAEARECGWVAGRPEGCSSPNGGIEAKIVAGGVGERVGRERDEARHAGGHLVQGGGREVGPGGAVDQIAVDGLAREPVSVVRVGHAVDKVAGRARAIDQETGANRGPVGRAADEGDVVAGRDEVGAAAGGNAVHARPGAGRHVEACGAATDSRAGHAKAKAGPRVARRAAVRLAADEDVSAVVDVEAGGAVKCLHPPRLGRPADVDAAGHASLTISVEDDVGEDAVVLRAGHQGDAVGRRLEGGSVGVRVVAVAGRVIADDPARVVAADRAVGHVRAGRHGVGRGIVLDEDPVLLAAARRTGRHRRADQRPAHVARDGAARATRRGQVGGPADRPGGR